MKFLQFKKVNSGVIGTLKILWSHLSYIRKCQFIALLFLMLFVSCTEIVSIGVVLPFLSALVSPEEIFKNNYIKPILQFIQINDLLEFRLFITFLFIATVVFSTIFRILLLWASNYLSYSCGNELSVAVYRRILYQPYTYHCNSNTSELINGISYKTDLFTQTLTMVLTLISSLILIFCVSIFLCYLNPFISFVIFSCFGLIYLVVIYFTKKKLLQSSKVIAHQSSSVIKYIQEGLGSIRDILLDNNQEEYCKTYKSADFLMRKAQSSVLFISNSPRYLIESLGIFIIAVLAYKLSETATGLSDGIPLIGALALGAQKLLPVFQQAYGSFSQVLGNEAAIFDVNKLLNQELPKNSKENFSRWVSWKRIKLKNIYFRYSYSSPYVLNDLNFSISTGNKIGIIGESGAGKSTLVDIFMGLLKPTKGSLEVDGEVISAKNIKSWQLKIAHVPQALFLKDGTIMENIAFGIPVNQIDFDHVRACAKKAQLDFVVDALPNNYKTMVGERGIRLSGGQVQRIGIARALYKNPDIIIFDEATSSLDIKTEFEVMKAINNLSKDFTVLIITHRLSTLKSCDKIFEIKKGIIKKILSHKKMVNKVKYDN